MMSIFLAVSIDYSLFLLSRFRQEVKACKVPDPAETNAIHDIVTIVLKTSGKVVLASGTTLAVCFLGVLALPLDLIQSIGVGCAISLMYVMTYPFSPPELRTIPHQSYPWFLASEFEQYFLRRATFAFEHLAPRCDRPKHHRVPVLPLMLPSFPSSSNPKQVCNADQPVAVPSVVAGLPSLLHW
jgi:hypothetical protein